MSKRDPWKHHETDVIKMVNLDDGSQQYHGFCRTCGWMGRFMDAKSDANNDADQHAIAMAGEE